MVFSSFPVYLDHPNLHQFPQQPADYQQQGSTTTVVDHNGQVLHQPPPPPPVLAVGGGGSIRPGSMVDRARLAKLPLPEAGLKCPRCDSTNTKFCYFNNYSLTQPRHFCKTCRRYWTRGGALRNVPVGGGCRRNKKTKSGGTSTTSGGSKSCMNTADHQQIRQGGSNNNIIINSTTNSTASPSRCSPDHVSIQGHFNAQPSSHQLPFMAAFQNLNHHYGPSLMGGFQAQLLASTTTGSDESVLPNMGFNNLGGSGNIGNDDQQWRLPNLGGLIDQAQPSLFPLIQAHHDHDHERVEAASSSMLGQQLGSSLATASSGQINASVKREENNLTKQFLVNSEGNQFWGTAAASPWTGFSGLNSSNSTSHLL